MHLPSILLFFGGAIVSPPVLHFSSIFPSPSKFRIALIRFMLMTHYAQGIGIYSDMLSQNGNHLRVSCRIAMDYVV